MKAIAAMGVGLMLLIGCQSTNTECCTIAPEDPAPVSMGLPEMESTLDALAKALEDERKSEAMYMAVMKVHGERRPFSMIVNAERNHQRALITQFERLGVEVPQSPTFEFEVPETFEGACEMAAQSEIDNASLYDEIEAAVSDPQILRVFSRLRSASENCHLPAFQRAAGGDATGGCAGDCGQVKGKGQGKGQGQGQGKGGGCGEGGGGCGGGGCGEE